MEIVTNVKHVHCKIVQIKSPKVQSCSSVMFLWSMSGYICMWSLYESKILKIWVGKGWNVPCVGQRGVYSLLNEVCGQFDMSIEENVTVIVEERKIMKDRYVYVYIRFYVSEWKKSATMCLYSVMWICNLQCYVQACMCLTWVLNCCLQRRREFEGKVS